MNPKFLSFFRIVLLLVFLMQVFVSQAEEILPNPLDNFSNSAVLKSVQHDSITLSQFKSMSWKELDNFFKQNEREMLPRFRLGRTFSYIGLGSMISGAVITSAGVVLLTCFPEYPQGNGYVIFRTPEYLGGIILTTLGSAITTAGISFTISGYGIKNQCRKSYIDKHFNNSTLSTIKIGSSNNGIGLTLNF